MSRSPQQATVLCLVVALGALAAFAQEPQPAVTVPDVRPGPDQWIAPIPGDVDVPLCGWKEYRRAQWVVWPSDEYIAARQPPKDRRRQFPAVYPDGDRRLKPLRAGASSLRRVRQSCGAWLRELLKPEYAPQDLAAALVMLQEDDPASSSVMGRHEVGGTGVQVKQFRWARCVVIRPNPVLIEGLAPKAIGPALFRAVFRRGEEMSGYALVPVPGMPEGLWAFEAAARDGTGIEWWRRCLWYTDGRAVAAYFNGNDGGAFVPLPGSPWF